MPHDAPELTARLAREAEAVCRHYLSNGRREGAYWRVGDVRNTPGRSLFVRLCGDANGRPAGKWTDAATGEHGDLLDLIRESCGLADFHDVTEEARRFLSLPRARDRRATRPKLAPSGSPQAARRLFAASQPVPGTLAERYLRARGIEAVCDLQSLRFHPRCYYRPAPYDPPEAWPAMIAAVTDLGGVVTGVHRTWLLPPRHGRPPCVKDRRALGHLLGNGVRFGIADDVLLAGEGIETTLSPGLVMPAMPLIAALSAAHLGALLFPASLKRLYVARDADPAGDRAFERLSERTAESGVEIVGLLPRLDDFNADLRKFGPGDLRRRLRERLCAEDAARFIRERSPSA
ncbi:MAG: DUF7146 domain-containing protein [Vitreimonas sp.]